MERFDFHSELFELRAAVMEELSHNGFVWLSNFGAVDLQHDTYGLEVTAIRMESDARAIEGILRRILPDWHYARTFYEDQNAGELGWKIIISRRPENYSDQWHAGGTHVNRARQVSRFAHRSLSWLALGWKRPKR